MSCCRAFASSTGWRNCGTLRSRSAPRERAALMKCRLIAAGTRLPDWVNSGFHEYQKRLRAPLVLELHEIPVATRRAGESPHRAVLKEGAHMLAALKPDDYVVSLEIAAKAMSTLQLSAWLAERLRDG